MVFAVTIFMDFEGGNGLGKNCCVTKTQMLLQVPEGVTLGNINAARIGGIFADDQFEQGGLACSIAAGDADAFSGIHLEGDVPEEFLKSEGFG